MIRRLHIENYALIAQLDIELHKGFSVITGETGAGKSIILGAIGLLRGLRADTKAIKTGERRCVVEAEFDVAGDELGGFFEANDLDFDGSECIIRRELTANGKSRAFINDTPVSLSLLKEIGDQLVDIHSQHQNLLLGKEHFQLSILDILAQNQELLKDYQSAYEQMRQTSRLLSEARSTADKSREEEDYLRFQFQQIDEAQLTEGEQAELEAEAEMLEHAEDIKHELYEAQQAIDGGSETADTLSLLQSAKLSLQSIVRNYQPADELANRIDSCLIELKDVAAELERKAEQMEFDPQRLEWVKDRLNLIYSLEMKHHVDSVDALIALARELDERIQAIDNSDEHIRLLEQQLEAATQAAQQRAAALSATRQKAARQVEQQMEESLKPLGMPNVRFRVEIDSATDAAAFHTNGADKVTFLFSANKSGQLQNVAQVASGGEIARVMLSLKAMIASAVTLPTIIFDEIDTGVSGGIAGKMARIMQQMGKGDRQVISITHLPQIAAIGASHYRVFKQDAHDQTTSHIVELNAEERVEEIAHMLSGETLTEAAIENARSLLQQ